MLNESRNINADAQTDAGDSIIPENARECPIHQNRLNDAYRSLNDKQKTAVEMLAIGKSLGRVSKFIEVDAKTLYRWRQDPSFNEALYRRRRELWSDAIDRVRGMVTPSLDIVEHHLSDRYERIRFRAAQTVLNLASIKKHASEAPDPE